MKTITLMIFTCLLVVGIYVWSVGRPLTLDKDLHLPFAMSEEYKSMLYHASMAPSGHNTQPWKVIYDARSHDFTLFLNRDRELAQVDPENREAFISLGAFLENWQQSAQAYGYTPKMSILPTPGAQMEIAHVTFNKTSHIPADSEQRLARMTVRHTDKRNYEPHNIPPTTIHTLLERNGPWLRYYPKGTPGFAWLSRNTVEAMKTQGEHEGKRGELSQWIRFSNTEARQARDGLPAEQLGMKGPLKAAFYTFYNRQDTTTPSFARESVKLTEQQVGSAAGFFVITGAGDFQGIIRAGMHFERFWLDAVELGISLHPMSQILEEKPFSDDVMKALNLNAPVQMIVRAGITSNYGENNGIRRNISRFTSINESCGGSSVP